MYEKARLIKEMNMKKVWFTLVSLLLKLEILIDAINPERYWMFLFG
jgi:hypothetical protein